MAKQFRWFFLLACMSMAFAFLPFGVGWANGESPFPPLFQASDETFDVSLGSTDLTLVRSQVVTLEPGVLPQADGASGVTTFVLNLFDDVSPTVQVDRVEQIADGGQTIHGHLLSPFPGTVTMVSRDGYLMGNIFSAQGTYQIRGLDGTRQVVREIDPSRFPPAGEPLTPPEFSEPAEVADGPFTDDGSRVDVLVMYTSVARDTAGGTAAIEALIDLAETETNDSYTNSGITHTVRVVHKELANYDETGKSFTTMLNDVTFDGVPNVATLRDTHGADLVVFLVEGSGAFCGKGWQMETVSTTFASFGYSVVSRDCATGNFSFGHEIGHNSAARHDRANDSTEGVPFTFNHGLKDTVNSFRTIMAVLSGTRIQYWSNPNVNAPPEFGSAPTGIPEGQADAADNRKTLNQTAVTVANFRAEAGGGGHSLSITNVSATPNPVASGSTVNLSVSATDSQTHTLTPTWSAVCTDLGSNGTFSATVAQSPTWTAPTNSTGSAKTCSISVTVDDGGFGLSDTSMVTVTVNSEVPETLTITAGPTATPNPVVSGGTVNASVTAVHSGGKAITYLWSATCSGLGSNGTFSNTAVQNPTWTAPTNSTGSPLNCTLTVNVSDGFGLMHSGNHVQTVNSDVVNTLEIINGPSGTPNPVTPGGTVNMTALGNHTGGEPFTYDWSADCPLIANGSFNNNSLQNPAWNAPSNNTGSPVDCTISLTVDDGQGLTDTKTYIQTVNSSVAHSLTVTAGPLAVPNPVDSEGSVNLSLTANHTNSLPITFLWTSSCPGLNNNGSFNDPTSQNPTWAAPRNASLGNVFPPSGQDEVCTLTVMASDGQGLSDTEDLMMTVLLDTSNVLSITSGPTATPNPVSSGGLVSLSVSASHGNFSAFDTLWTADCGEFGNNGTFANETSMMTTWTAPNQFTNSPLLCTLMVTVSDNQGNSDSSSVAVTVNTQAADTLTITSGPTGTPKPVASGGAVAMDVTANHSGGLPFTYAWTSTCSTLSTSGAFNNVSIKNPTWTAPVNSTGSQATCNITVAVNDGFGLSHSGSYSQTVESIASDFSVNPVVDQVVFGNQGGPFAPVNFDFKVKTTGASATYTVSKSQSWLDLNHTGGTLAPGQEVDVGMSINANANSLAPGVHFDTVTFSDTNSGGNIPRNVNLVVGTGADSSRVSLPKKNFAPSCLNFVCNQVQSNYTLTNLDSTSLSFSAAVNQNWLDVEIQTSPQQNDPEMEGPIAVHNLPPSQDDPVATGTLDPDQTATIIVTLNSTVSEEPSGQATLVVVDTTGNSVLSTDTITLTVSNDVFDRPSGQRVVSPYWQADTNSYTFLAVTHPSLTGMNSQIGVAISAVQDDGNLFGPAATFTVNSNTTQKVFIVGPNNPTVNATNNPDGKFIVGAQNNQKGQVVFNPTASNPERLAGLPTSQGRGYTDVGMLNYWGAVVVQGSLTGFAMEFIGDNQDSRAYNLPFFSGVN